MEKYFFCYLEQFTSLVLRPEYLALIISVTAIIATVYTAYKNRVDAFSKEEYFKLQQIAEQIVSKLIILEHHRKALKIFFEESHKAETTNTIFLDTNNTFDKSRFDTNSEVIAAYLEIYFPELGSDYNTCLINMGELFSSMLVLEIKIKKNHDINWKEEKENFNKISKKISAKPTEISEKIIKRLKKYKEEHFGI